MQQMILDKEKKLNKVELLYLVYLHKLKMKGISIEDISIEDIIMELSIDHRTYYKMIDNLKRMNLIDVPS